MNETELVRRFYGAASLEELERMYRQLSKHTHPDLTGRDDADFKVLSRVYREARELLTSREGPSTTIATTKTATTDFDPWVVITELGYTRRLSPRACLVLALYRYHSAGLGKRRIKASAALEKRNTMIIATVRHWAALYDPNLVPCFDALVEGITEGLMPTAFLKASQEVRRGLEEGITHWFRWHDEGREVARQLAQSAFDGVLDMVDVYRLDGHPAGPYAQWFIKDLTEGPALARPA